MTGQGIQAGQVIVGAGEPPTPAPGRTGTASVTNHGRFTAYLTSHFPLARASRELELDRAGLEGARARLPAGASIEIPPGETVELEVIWD